MPTTKTRYRDLFDLLRSLGFSESKQDGVRAFTHANTDAVLLFGRPEKDAITSADLLSTDVHLQGKGITDKPLEALLSPATVS